MRTNKKTTNYKQNSKRKQQTTNRVGKRKQQTTNRVGKHKLQHHLQTIQVIQFTKFGTSFFNKIHIIT
jgi:hypothetical protein